MGVERTTHQHTFSIKTEVFEGPLELLVDLIEKRKLLINDISLAAVTDEYMVHVAQMQEHALRETANFVVVASTLLLIKSRSLLPVFDLTSEEEENIEELQDRLRVYQIFRDAAKGITERFDVSPMFERRFVRDETPLFITDAYCDSRILRDALAGVINSLPKIEEKPKVRVRNIISLEDMLSKLRERVERQMKFGFKDFTGASSEPSVVIVGFLAILEMVKQGNIIVSQIRRFEDIEIERESGSIPRYM